MRPLTSPSSAGSPAPQRRLRVLHLIRRLSDSGGAERFAAGLALNLPRERIESYVCTARGGDESVFRAFEEAGIPVVSLGRRARWDVHRLAGLAGLMRRGHFDIVHTHTFGSNLWGMVLGRVSGIPVRVAHEHTWSYEGDPVRVWLDGNVIGRLATRFIAVSSADARRMVSIEGVPAEKVLVMPTAYVPNERPATGGDLRAELGLAPDTLLVGTVAVFRAQKALHVLIEAHRQVNAVLPDVHLVLVGDGDCRAELEELTARLGLEGRVHFTGRRADVDPILRGLDVAALSSDFEGTPLFVFECMANRTPLVATAVGGVAELVEPGRTGVLVPRRNPEALAEALIGLLQDPSRRKALADAAFVGLEDFTIAAVAERFATLYESLAQEGIAGVPDAPPVGV